MKNKLMTLAGALVLLAVFGRFYATPLIAQVRAALVKNIDERGRVPYQVTGSCVPSDVFESCDVVFPTVPAGKRVVLEYASAEVTSSFAVPALAVYQDIAGGANHTLPVYSRFIQNYGSNQAVLLYVEAGHQARIHGGFLENMSGTLVGYVVDLAQ